MASSVLAFTCNKNEEKHTEKYMGVGIKLEKSIGTCIVP